MSFKTKSITIASFILLAISTANAVGHYLDRYDPVAIYTMDKDPKNPRLADTKGKFKALVHKADAGLPKLEDGARDFTGKAWNFKGVDSSFCSEAGGRMQTIGDIENTKGISVSFWMKVALKDQKNHHRVLGHHAFEAIMAGAGYGGLGMNFGPYHTILPRAAGYTAFDNSWHHIVTTVDFSTRRQNVVMYLDGKEVKRTDGAANKSFNTTNPRARFYIGARTNGGNPFTGALDDVSVYDYPLSSEQVLGIYTGPIFAGAPMEVYLPDKAKLNAIAPKGKTLTWTKTSGKGLVKFYNPSAPDTKAAFNEPGDYELTMTVEGFAPQTLKVKVHPPTPPTVIAGDPIQIDSASEKVTLNGKVTVPGRKDGDLTGVKIMWQKASGPGTVTFSSKGSLKTQAAFSTEGLYTLKLKAGSARLNDTDTISVLVGKTSHDHYALLLNPLYLFGLDEPANRQSAGIYDLAQGTCAEVSSHQAETIPQLIKGARPYTGNAWDMAATKSTLKVHNRYNIARLGNIELTDGMSCSFWFKAENFAGRVGRMASISGNEFTPSKIVYDKEAAVSFSLTGTYLTSPKQGPNRNLFDNKWHHVVAVADFKATTNNYRLYVDGKEVAKDTKVFDEIFGSERTDRTHFWGSRGDHGNDPFKGQLDDIMAFDYPLNTKQIAYLYNGPDSEQKTLIAQSDPKASAGDDIIIKGFPKSVTLHGKALNNPRANYTWKLFRGPGKVTIDNPTKLKTKVRFEPVSVELHNTDYRHYIFHLTASNGSGDIARATTDEVSVVLYKNDTPKTRKIAKTPDPGIHPRVLFTKDELSDMRKRIQNDPYAQDAIKNLTSYYKSNLFNPDNAMGLVYDQLKAGKQDVDVKFAVGDNDTRGYWQGKGGLYGHINGAGFIALMARDDAKCTELATVLARAATEHLKYYRPNYPNKLIHDASGGLALGYDTLYNHMTEDQRKPVRLLLSKMTKWRQTDGTSTHHAYHNSTNWKTHHDQIVLGLLAIEGEEGYDEEFADQATNKLRVFLTQYGLFNSGYAHEGYTYYRMGMESGSLSAYALSRRGENLYETTNIYNSVKMMFRSVPPGRIGVTGYGDASPLIKSMDPLDWTIRYLWPEDKVTTYLIKRRLDYILAKEPTDRVRTDSLAYMAMVFATEPQTITSQKQAAKEHDMPETSFCPDKGYVNARSSWDDSAINLTFRCRMDKFSLGHMHPDINTFDLFANGTVWFIDPGKYDIYNDFHQTILIDGLGGGGSVKGWTWPSFPGKFVEFKETKDMVLGVGDAKPFYDYVPSNKDRNTGKEFTPITAERHNLTWADFVYDKTRNDNLPAWRYQPLNYHNNGTVFSFNPVKRAFRSAALIKGKYPYILIVDDYQKDNAKHVYEWLANADFRSVETVSQNGNDLIIKKTGTDDIGNRLLIRLLDADGQVTGPKLREICLTIKNETKPNATQVIITAKDVVSPNFKVLIYPFTEGRPLPKTSLTNSRLTVSFPGQKDTFKFKPDNTGRTIIDKD